MRKLIVISDWAADSVYRQQFSSSVAGNMRSQQDPLIKYVAAPANSIASGFILAQIALTEKQFGRPQHTIIFQGSERFPDQTQEKSKFFIARLFTNMIVCGFNLGYVFSDIEPDINELFSYTLDESGSSFLSRDVYARVLAHLIDEMEHELDMAQEHRASITKYSTHNLVYIDTFGNLITNIRLQDLKGKHEFEDKITVRIGFKSHQLRFVSSIAAGQENELIIAPSSFADSADPCLGVAVRTFDKKKSAHSCFEYPQIGALAKIL